MALAQRLLQRRMQLRGIDVAIVEVALDELRVDLDHLLDQRAVRRVDAAEVAVAFAVVEAVDDACAAGVGQVQRQALLAERGLDLLPAAPGRSMSAASILLTTIMRSSWRDAA